MAFISSIMQSGFSTSFEAENIPNGLCVSMALVVCTNCTGMVHFNLLNSDLRAPDIGAVFR